MSVLSDINISLGKLGIPLETEYELLSNTITDNPRALQILQHIANRPIYKKEELNDKKMFELFGGNYFGLV